MGRGAEAAEAKLFPVAGHHPRPPADQARTEQGCERNVVTGFAGRKCEARIGYRRRGEPPIARISGEDRVVAQVLPMHAAIRTDTAGVAEPGDADALADFAFVGVTQVLFFRLAIRG